MRQVKARRPAPSDPAPSKWRYRAQRLWLTPLFRALIRTGIPSFGFVILFTWYINDPARIRAIVDTWEETVRAVQDRPEFMVSLLRIEGASDELQADILEALPVDLPLSQFQLDMDGLRAMLVDLDPVLDAEVRVKAGGVLLLKVTEREPAVVWRHAEGIDVLDAEGHRVATLDDLAAAGALPIIAGEGASAHVPQALRLVRAADPVTDRLVGLTRVGDRRWDVVLTRGQRIALPETAPAAALDRALAMHAAKDVLNRDISVVDLRIPDRPILRLTGPARDELRRLQELERLSYFSED
ncbi:cell division protein FtsQ/DivIB [Jannaschia ovalis]|uniref:Cell division protein FtsQ n=1 Tax=Jannaschia ovalis TaxID=3038773 RepID=A0ABY8LCH7_9RHOB|nr:cell division protein FtsQ/DivIB [Jannaschia sp. GRR-S6-38]WGH79028.1 cell division protein FtsQ/DivIB [Jannaschia sp. GRR-S6-38]